MTCLGERINFRFRKKGGRVGEGKERRRRKGEEKKSGEKEWEGRKNTKTKEEGEKYKGIKEGRKEGKLLTNNSQTNRTVTRPMIPGSPSF